MNFTQLSGQLSDQMASVDHAWKTRVHQFMNESHTRETRVSDSTIANLLLLQLAFAALLAISWCCYHPCMACLPWNCYDPLRCNTHASWLHRMLRLVRDTLFFSLVLGVLILASVDDCSQRVTHILCKAGDDQSLLRQGCIWLSFGASCVMVREICRDSPWCSEAARSKDVDDRLLRLRSHRRHCWSGFCKRAQIANQPLTSTQDVVAEESPDDEDDEDFKQVQMTKDEHGDTRNQTDRV
jgi:hypothetical protein